MYKGVIFDFNGTLFEDYDLQEEAWRELIRKYFGRELEDSEFRSCFHGLGNVDILAYINSLDPEKQFDISITDEKETIYRQICREHPERVKFVPGVIETFEALKSAGIEIAIATASEITNVKFYYEFFHLERWFKPEHVLYDDRTFPLKPAPDVYLKAMERLNLSPKDCLICEDSQNGLIAAIASGAGRVIARKAGSSKESMQSDPRIYAVIEDFTGFYPKYLEDNN
jgi:HAD superfamily hydrolase (TIGR01509 family)